MSVVSFKAVPIRNAVLALCKASDAPKPWRKFNLFPLISTTVVGSNHNSTSIRINVTLERCAYIVRITERIVITREQQSDRHQWLTQLAEERLRDRIIELQTNGYALDSSTDGEPPYSPQK